MTEYQENFSALHPEVYYDLDQRKKKAQKMFRILTDHLGEDLSHFDALDMGCSTGSMAHILEDHFRSVTGVDIDESAIAHARENFETANVKFTVADAMDTGLTAESFDVIVCAHVYEHVPNARRMLQEVYRLLKPSGVCYFAAENRLVFREGDYRLPFLSLLPKFLAHYYLRACGRGDYYYERLMTYWGLKSLTADFQIIDYTEPVVTDPAAYDATDLIPPGSLKQRIALLIVKYVYWLFPDYLWLLKKPNHPANAALSTTPNRQK